jgi:hypothetical protein
VTIGTSTRIDDITPQADQIPILPLKVQWDGRDLESPCNSHALVVNVCVILRLMGEPKSADGQGKGKGDECGENFLDWHAQSPGTDFVRLRMMLQPLPRDNGAVCRSI